jgi:hypothetical protein
MFVRLQFLFAVLTAMFLVSCAEYPYVGVDATPSPNTGVAFNTFRGKIYFGPEATIINQTPDESARLLVIAPDAVPFLGQEPILLATDQEGAVTIRTDHSAITQNSSPNLLSVGELLGEYPQCPMPDAPVTTRLTFLSALQATFDSHGRATR